MKAMTLSAWAAISVTAVLTLTGCAGTVEDDRRPSAPSSSAATTKLVTVTIDPTKLRQGSVPEIAWFERDTLHLDGEIVELPGVDSVAVTKERLITYPGSGESGFNTFDVRDHRGKVTGSVNADLSIPDLGEYTLSRVPVVNADRTMVGWLDSKGEPWVLEDGHEEPMRLPPPKGLTEGIVTLSDPVALDGNDCEVERKVADGCLLYYSLSDQSKAGGIAAVSSSDGKVAIASKHIGSLADVSSEGALIGSAPVAKAEAGFCTRYETRNLGGWTSCSLASGTFPYSDSTFSRDGHYVAGFGQAGDEPFDPFVGLREARSGKAFVKASITMTGEGSTAVRSGPVWEDDSHVLFVVGREGVDGGTCWIVRLGLDGSAELAVGATKNEPVDRYVEAPALRFATLP